jgi:cytochrome c oxidase cbb3-type subunit 3
MITPDHRFRSNRWIWIVLAIALVLGGAALEWRNMRTARLDTEILSLLPDEVPNYPDLVRVAATEGKPVYADKCAACHGADLKGSPQTGAPNLSDAVWLYGTGRVSDIERTIMYGVRSGNPKAHNVTEMPAFGLGAMLTPAEINDAVQYVLSLSHRPNLAEAARAGRDVYFGKGMCNDCHGPDARGDNNYGSSNLTINVWNNGGDSASLYRSLYYGVAHICPAWYGLIPLEKIRALAVYLHSVSHSGGATYVPAAS